MGRGQRTQAVYLATAFANITIASRLTCQLARSFCDWLGFIDMDKPRSSDCKVRARTVSRAELIFADLGSTRRSGSLMVRSLPVSAQYLELGSKRC
jgi:hypothetical protein